MNLSEERFNEFLDLWILTNPKPTDKTLNRDICRAPAGALQISWHCGVLELLLLEQCVYQGPVLGLW